MSAPLDTPTPTLPLLPEKHWFDWETNEGLYRYHITITNSWWDHSGDLKLAVTLTKHSFRPCFRRIPFFRWKRVWEVAINPLTLRADKEDHAFLCHQLKVSLLNKYVDPSEFLLNKCTGPIRDYRYRKCARYEDRDEGVNSPVRLRSIDC